MSDSPQRDVTQPVPSTASATDDEVAALRAELARLRAEAAADGRAGPATGPATGPAGRRSGWWRAPVSVVLLLVAALLVPLSVVAIWADDAVGDSDRYVETVAPLADDPAVQAAVTERITEEIFTRLDVEELTGQAVDALAARGLPPRLADVLSALRTPLANGVRDFVERQVARLVASQEFADAWSAANREAHGQLVAVLTGQGDLVETEGTTVTVNLATVVNAVKARLSERGFTLAERVPAVGAEFTIVESDELPRLQRGFRLLDTLAAALPVLALVLFAAGVAVARSRRRALVGGALSVVAALVLLGLSLNLSREVYLSALPAGSLPPDAAGVIYDRLVLFIRFNVRALLVVFLAVALLAWLSGPGEAPTGLRRTTTRAIDAVRHGSEARGLSTGRLGEVLGTYRGALRAAVLGGALLVYVMRDHPTGQFALVVLAVALLLLLVLELLARPVEREVAEPAPPGA